MSREYKKFTAQQKALQQFEKVYQKKQAQKKKKVKKTKKMAKPKSIASATKQTLVEGKKAKKVTHANSSLSKEESHGEG